MSRKTILTWAPILGVILGIIIWQMAGGYEGIKSWWNSL